MSAWPMAEMQKQIDAMREAFSADVRKPFVLKPSFPYGSPQSTTRPSPPGQSTSFLPLSRNGTIDHNIDTAVSQHSHVNYTTHPISPPISAGPADCKSDSSPPPQQSLVMMAAGQVSQAPALPAGMSLPDGPAWNPSRIFEYVNFQAISPWMMCMRPRWRPGHYPGSKKSN